MGTQLLDGADKVTRFLTQLASKKKDYRHWSFIHIAKPKTDTATHLGEIIQFMQQHFQEQENILIQLSDDELMMATDTTDNLLFSSFEKLLYQNFPNAGRCLTAQPLHSGGLKSFVRLIQPHLPANDCAAQIAMLKASRLSNCILVMDDDEMVLRQAEHCLTSLGRVIVLQKPEDFLNSYKMYAPDVVFLDIHLPNNRGTDMLFDLLGKIDPNAYVVMISSDTAMDTVVESKVKGTKGFIMKPLTRQSLAGYVMKSPSFVPKQSHAFS